jgi:membrane associated rhomboid family serine protease
MNMLQTAPAATLILATFVIASLWALYAAPGMLERGVLRPHTLVPQREWHTLVTSAFLHADLAHLFFNGFTFFAFGFGLEQRMGTPAFVALYFFGMLVSDAGTWLKQRHNPQYRTLGASGAILAVLFASIVYFPSNSIFILPIPVPIPAPLFALAYLAYSIYASRRGGGRINHDAHLSGAVAGVLFVAASDPAAFDRAWQSIVG